MNRFLFTRSELRGIAGLSTVLVIVRIGIIITPYPDRVKDWLSNDSAAVMASIQEVKSSLCIEINSSDSLRFEALRGIGPVLGSRIVRYRQLLGGFISKWQLAEVYGIDSSWVENHLEELSLDTSSIRKLDVNQSDFKDFLRHPYLEYDDVKAICRYRDRLGPVHSTKILVEKGILSDSVWQRVGKYFICSSDSSSISQ